MDAPTPTETLLTLLSIAVAGLAIISFFFGAVGTAWRKLRGKKTPIEELRDQIARTGDVAEETLELRKSEIEARKTAAVSVIKFKTSRDRTHGRVDPSGLQIENAGPAVARQVWADIQLTPMGTVERSDTITQLLPNNLVGLVGRGQSDATAPDRSFGDDEVHVRYGWEDESGSRSSEWELHIRRA